jgi:aerobic carbon-monoxide dehydrogenase large subunit
MKTVNSYIGSPVERVEDLRFLRGKGQFIGDFACDGQWHAAFVRSAVAHGTIRSIDAASALSMSGVHAVVTAADIPRPLPAIPFRRPNAMLAPYAQPVIASGKVRYVGEPIAMILAASAAVAEDAQQLVTVDIDALPAVVDWQASVQGRTLLFEQTGGNVAATFTATRGDADTAFAAADYVRRERFSVQRQTALPMEPRGLLAAWDAATGRLCVFGAAKLPFFNRAALAAMMGLAEHAVSYVELDVGGGFGARGEFYPEDFLLAFAARRFGHPVKWIEDRREHLMAIGHAREMTGEIEIACRRDGTIDALRGIIHVDMGAYVRPNGTTPVRNVAQFLSGPYRVPHICLEARGVVSNKTPAGTYRGPGRYEGCFFCERMIDLAARDLGIDRLEMRRRNLLTAAEMPVPFATVAPDEGLGRTAGDSGDYPTALERCVGEFGWHGKRDMIGKLIGGRYHGLGIACFIEGGGSGPRENARIEVAADGSVAVYVGSSAIGQGLETVMAQIAADALEIPLERIRVMHGSTHYLHEGFGSYGSRATVMGGSAVVVAAGNLLKAFTEAAAARLSADASGLKIADGVARTADGRSISLAEAACSAPLVGEGSFTSSKPTYTYGAAAAHVAVDPATGHVEILDYVVVDDAGRVINPLTLHGQVIGATVQGLGSVFSEHLQYDQDGQLLVGSLADYLLPLATDYPNLRAISMHLYPSPNNPLGAKGAGEGGIIPVGGAVSNAVASALGPLGVELRDLPLTPPRLWDLINRARAGRRLQAGSTRP